MKKTINIPTDVYYCDHCNEKLGNLISITIHGVVLHFCGDDCKDNYKKENITTPLKPCPFCGCNALVKETEGQGDCDYDKTYYDIMCSNESCYLCEGADWNYTLLDEVIKLWNTRK